MPKCRCKTLLVETARSRRGQGEAELARLEIEVPKFNNLLLDARFVGRLTATIRHLWWENADLKQGLKLLERIGKPPG